MASPASDRGSGTDTRLRSTSRTLRDLQQQDAEDDGGGTLNFKVVKTNKHGNAQERVLVVDAALNTLSCVDPVAINSVRKVFPIDKVWFVLLLTNRDSARWRWGPRSRRGSRTPLRAFTPSIFQIQTTQSIFPVACACFVLLVRACVRPPARVLFILLNSVNEFR